MRLPSEHFRRPTDPVPEPEPEALPDEPYGPDIIGLQVGMKIEDADSFIREHMRVGWVFESDQSDPTLEDVGFRNAKFYMSTEKEEAIALDMYSPAVPGMVVGIWRINMVSAEDADADSIVQVAHDKYGPPRSESEGSGKRSQIWGNNLKRSPDRKSPAGRPKAADTNEIPK